MCYLQSLVDWNRIQDQANEPQLEDFYTLEEWEEAYYEYWDMKYATELEYGEACYDAMTEEWW